MVHVRHGCTRALGLTIMDSCYKVHMYPISSVDRPGARAHELPSWLSYYQVTDAPVTMAMYVLAYDSSHRH